MQAYDYSIDNSSCRFYTNTLAKYGHARTHAHHTHAIVRAPAKIGSQNHVSSPPGTTNNSFLFAHIICVFSAHCKSGRCCCSCCWCVRAARAPCAHRSILRVYWRTKSKFSCILTNYCYVSRLAMYLSWIYHMIFIHISGSRVFARHRKTIESNRFVTQIKKSLRQLQEKKTLREKLTHT